MGPVLRQMTRDPVLLKVFSSPSSEVGSKQSLKNATTFNYNNSEEWERLLGLGCAERGGGCHVVGVLGHKTAWSRSPPPSLPKVRA